MKDQTNGPGKGKGYVSTTVDADVLEEIERRRKALGWSRGKYLREILLGWQKMGAPPVSNLDRLLVNEEYTSYNSKKRQQE